MIGSRLLAAAALLAIAPGLGGGAPRPDVAIAANQSITDAADRTLAAIDRLEGLLLPGVDAGRAGAARVVAGADDPAEPLLAAAETIRGAEPAALELREALVGLERARAANSPDTEPLPDAPGAGDLASIADQLVESAEAGAAYATMRLAVEGVSANLLEALEAVAAGDIGAGRAQLDVASAAVDELRAWEDAAPTLTVWMRTANAMIRAMHRLADAVEDRNAAEARQARAAFDAAAERAPQADRALRIGIGEAGSALTATPLRRLADLLRDLEELDVAVHAALAEVGR
jgi:hypothetical protein